MNLDVTLQTLGSLTCRAHHNWLLLAQRVDKGNLTFLFVALGFGSPCKGARKDGAIDSTKGSVREHRAAVEGDRSR